MDEHSFGNKSLDTLDQTMQKTSRFKIINSDNLNKAIYHITNLINDASYLYKNESYATSAFLAITIIEEVAKTNNVPFRAFKIDGADHFNIVYPITQLVAKKSCKIRVRKRIFSLQKKISSGSNQMSKNNFF